MAQNYLFVFKSHKFLKRYFCFKTMTDEFDDEFGCGSKEIVAYGRVPACLIRAECAPDKEAYIFLSRVVNNKGKSLIDYIETRYNSPEDKEYHRPRDLQNQSRLCFDILLSACFFSTNYEFIRNYETFASLHIRHICIHLRICITSIHYFAS